jgi:predicted transcriptional regulator of viral defense system
MTANDIKILNLIADNELSIIDSDTISSLTGNTYVELKPFIRKLICNGQLYPIEKGLYCVRNFRNPYVIGISMAKNGSIAYWSALNLHGLTEQIPNVVYVQSDRRKADKKVFNVLFKFIQVKTEKICGITQMGYGNEQFKVTDVEKTLLDCFDLPQHSGGYEELLRAFYSARINSDKLLKYAVQMNNLSVIKRVGYLSELFEMEGLGRFRKKAQMLLNKSYSLLDPMGEDTGKFNSSWRLRINIPKEKLLKIVQKMY